MVDVVVSLPQADASALEDFERMDGDSIGFSETRSLDGNTMATALVSITLATLPVLKAWLISRVEAKKGCLVTFEGVTLQGYTAEEVSRIVAAIESQIADDRATD